MKKRKIFRIFLLFFILILFTIILYKDKLIRLYNKCFVKEEISVDLSELEGGDNPDSLLQVHFIDVGQGDATLITYKGQAMLIDGGDNSKGTAIQYYLKEQGIDTLDYVVATHPDADHIGGLDVVIYKFDCKNIIMPDVSKDTQSYEDMMMSVEEKEYQIHHPYQGEVFYMGDIKFTVLSPKTDTVYEDVNDYSIVLLMEYKDISFIFTGDAGYDVMNDILAENIDISADIYKAGHHGSSDSLNEDFLREVSPSYAVISCGLDNDYGHPHHEVLDYFNDEEIEVYRTDLMGDIIVYSDGKKVAWSTEK